MIRIVLVALFVLFSTSIVAQASTPAVNQLYAEAKQLHSFDEAVELYNRYVKTRSEMPFIFTHDAPTAKVAVLLHSVTRDPSDMFDLGVLLYKKGFNVVAPVFEGHCPDGLKMRDVVKEDWEADARFALDVASHLGNEVVISGYSLGGLVAVDTILKYPNEISAMILQAPAIWTDVDFSDLACVGKFLANTFTGPLTPKNLINGACPLRRMIDEVERTIPRPYGDPYFDWYSHMRKVYGQIHVPVYVAYSDADQAVDADTVRMFIDSLPIPATVQFYPRKLDVTHRGVDYLDLSGSDGRTMADSLSEFIDRL